MSSLFRLFYDCFKPSLKLEVGDLVRVTERLSGFETDTPLIILGFTYPTSSWTIAEVIKPGSSNPEAIDAAWLQKWDGGQS